MVVRDEEFMREALDLFGDPAVRARELEAFSADLDSLDAQRDRLTAQYDEQWIGFYRGSVVAHGAEPKAVVSAMRANGVPTGHGILRFLSSKPQRMIL